MSNSIEWSSFWDAKAKSQTDFQATGRSKMDIVGFLFTIREIAMALELGPNDEVLDIGCGTGIVALTLSPWVHRVHGLDISEKMVNRAKANANGVDNLTFSQGDIVSLDRTLGHFDKICAYSVLQYLRNEDEVFQAFQEVSAMLKQDGIAYLAANPDPQHKDRYMKLPLESNFSDEEQELHRQVIENTLWIPRERISELAKKVKLRSEVKDINPNIWQHFYMYDVVVRHERS